MNTTKQNNNKIPIIDLLIAFSKEIYSQNAPRDKKVWIQRSFFPQTTHGEPGGIGVKISITYDGRKVLNKIISIIKETFDGYIERKSLEKIIIDYILDNLFNKNYFDGDCILFSENATIFKSIIYKNPREFSKVLYNDLALIIKNNIRDSIILYPVSRISGQSFIIDKLNLEYRSVDDKTIHSYIKQFPDLENFNFEDGSYYDNKSYFSNNKINGWLICKVNGEEDSSLTVAKLKFKMFFGILFSILASDNIGFTNKSMASTETIVTQFTSTNIRYLSIGNLLHSFPGEIILTEEIIYNIQKIYSILQSLDNSKFQRYELASNYIINSLMAEDIEKFINLFVALDALWGVNGKSRKSIVNGIEKVDGKNQQSINKANSLYNLRCEIIHGSCLLLDDWKYNDVFINKYSNEPLRELQQIAFKSIKNVIV